MLRFSANLGFLWVDLPLVDRVRAAKAAGFDAVEFHFPYETPAETSPSCNKPIRMPLLQSRDDARDRIS